MIKNYIVAEYSVIQDCFHIHDLKSAIEHNIENAITKKNSDYLMIGLFETEVDAYNYIEKFRGKMSEQKDNWVDGLIKKTLK